MGGDGIPPAILKGAATALLDPIHHLFQLCVSQSSIPTQWRDHYITPIPKSGDKSVISNYRPISLLSSISKLFEKVVSDKIFDFLIDASVSNCQYGFIRNRSTIKQLLLHTKNIINALEDHQQLDTVLLDIRKAFDTVPHHILLTKLWQAGITGSLWQLVSVICLTALTLFLPVLQPLKVRFSTVTNEIASLRQDVDGLPTLSGNHDHENVSVPRNNDVSGSSASTSSNKFSIVISGISECCQGTRRSDHTSF
uniref:Reverse transcriptase domain-containing protein n=1 Tax=Amphimedon queenslandica TaxID=400682 RepID=A0A1X7U0K9_AMPQE